jgi:hypothetical protein
MNLLKTSRLILIGALAATVAQATYAQSREGTRTRSCPARLLPAP